MSSPNGISSVGWKALPRPVQLSIESSLIPQLNAKYPGLNLSVSLFETAVSNDEPIWWYQNGKPTTNVIAPSGNYNPFAAVGPGLAVIALPVVGIVGGIVTGNVNQIINSAANLVAPAINGTVTTTVTDQTVNTPVAVSNVAASSQAVSENPLVEFINWFETELKTLIGGL
jgi:hypothetical protein